jgi:hypothetical protein
MYCHVIMTFSYAPLCRRDEEIDELCSALLGAFAGAESDESRLQLLGGVGGVGDRR